MKKGKMENDLLVEREKFGRTLGRLLTTTPLRRDDVKLVSRGDRFRTGSDGHAIVIFSTNSGQGTGPVFQ
jgi:hypothetical protein